MRAIPGRAERRCIADVKTDRANIKIGVAASGYPVRLDRADLG
jgi:hypothetical protein